MRRPTLSRREAAGRPRPARSTRPRLHRAASLILAAFALLAGLAPQAQAQTDPVVTIERRGAPFNQAATSTEGASLRLSIRANPAPSGPPLVVNLQASGAAGFGIDQDPFTVPVRSSGVAHISEDTTNDVLDEADAVVTYTVLAGTGYTVGTPSSVTITVQDDDTLPGAPSIDSVTAAGRQLTVAWSAPSDPGYSDGTDLSHTDNAVTAYDVRHILSSATDKSDGRWTVEDDAWTGGDLEYTVGASPPGSPTTCRCAR